jgi:thioredoxin reductase (NADPH)
MNSEKNHFDLIIIGGGPAGLSAALWADELGLAALLLEKETEFGGQLRRVYNRIENHLGVETENGREMRDIFVRQIEKRGFVKRLAAEVFEIDAENKTVSLGGKQFSADFLVIATGVRRRKLDVPGEELFQGKGIIESGKKESETAAGKTTLIVGGGDAALENALILAEHAKKVYLAHRRADFRGRTEFLERINANRKIEILTETVVERIGGNERLERVETRNLRNSETRILSVETVLIRIGVTPNTEVLRGKVKLDDAGYVEIDSCGETSVKRVFAAGDVANPLAPTVSSAIGMGATAAKTIFARLTSAKSL